jgi:hypothetical protein
MGEFRKFEFHPLSLNKDARNEELKKVRLPAIYVWGDGGDHGDSYFFTFKGKRSPECKINLDQHSDGALGGKSGTRMRRKELWQDRYVGCGTHMEASYCQGMRVYSAHTFYDRMHPYSGEDIRTMMRILASRAHLFEQSSVAITVDLDAVINFPAKPRWFFRNDGILSGEIPPFIEAFRGKLLCGDVGGIVGNIPDFTLLGRTTEIPNAKLGFDVAEYYGPFSLGEKPTSRVLNTVASYAFYGYMDVILAFGKALS